MKVKDKIFVITGGGNGLGRELALAILRAGGKAAIVDINRAALDETVRLAERFAETGPVAGRLLAIEADITDIGTLEDMRDKIDCMLGPVDGVINNAGIIQPFRRINDMDFDAIERIFGVNFRGALGVLKTFIPGLLLRPEGHVVNVSSMGGFVPVAGQSIYGASKAALKILSEGLASELANTRVGVTTVFPGAMFTDIKANSGLGPDAGAGTEGHAANAALSPRAAAGMIVRAIEQNRSRLYVGKDARTMNILYRLNPAAATGLIHKKTKHKIS